MIENNKMTLGDRLNLFIQTCYGSQIIFSKEVDVDPSYLSRIINDKNIPGTELLIKFYHIGLSIDWLFDGKGSMYANHTNGQELNKKITGKNQLNKLTISDRLIKWISESYDNLENLCNIFNIKYEVAYKIVYESSVPDINFLYALNQAGCNTEWVLSGNGQPYENNPVGTILKYKKFGFDDITLQLDNKNIDNSILKKIKTTKDLYQFIKKIIQKEFDRRSKNEDSIYNNNDDVI